MTLPKTSRSLALTLAFVGLAACGGSGGGGGGGGGGGPPPVVGPEINVFTSKAAVVTAASVNLGVIAQTGFVAVPVFVRNSGDTVLNITGAIGIVPTNCTATLRDAAPASVAAGDTGHFTVLFKANTTGNPSALVTIPNDDANENPFTFTLTFTLNTATHATYTTAPNLYETAFPGVPTPTLLNSPIGVGATGVDLNFHLVDRSLYRAQLTLGGDTDLFLQGLGAALPAIETNLTASLTTPAGVFGPLRFAAGDNIVFAYNTGVPNVLRLFSLPINGAAPGVPLEISGTIPAGVVTGVTGIFPSPRGDQIAFLGDFTTAGTQELYVVAFTGGVRTKLSAGLPAGRTIDPVNVRWLPDQTGLLYETRVTATLQQRVLHHVALGGANPVTDLNGPVAAGRTGVIADRTRVSASGVHIFFLTDEANGTGKRDLRVFSLIGGTLAGPGVLNNGIAGPLGVGNFGLDFDGNKVLFIADSGAGNENELWQSLITDATPASTKVVPIAAAGRQVQFQGDRGVVSRNVAWFVHNDVNSPRAELFFLDWSLPIPTVTRVIDNVVYSGGIGIQSLDNDVQPQPDFHVAISSDQGNPGNMNVFGATLSNTPTAVRLNSLLFGTLPVVLGLRVAYESDNGAVPQNCWANLINGGAEIQCGTSSDMTGPPVLFSETRVLWHAFTPNLFNASTTAAGTQQDMDSPGADAGTVRVGNEPRP